MEVSAGKTGTGWQGRRLPGKGGHGEGLGITNHKTSFGHHYMIGPVAEGLAGRDGQPGVISEEFHGKSKMVHGWKSGFSTLCTFSANAVCAAQRAKPARLPSVSPQIALRPWQKALQSLAANVLAPALFQPDAAHNAGSGAGDVLISWALFW